MQVQLLPDALDGSFVYRLEDASPSRWRDGFDSHTSYMAKWWNGQTHDAQNVAPRKAWEFDSPLGYCQTRVSGLLRSGLESGSSTVS